ncbi:MAG TPA: diaminopimelate epimerase [Acidimicrobiia bacterium]|nr:diaminopimelate epimerase [Acidimicrobiia bacterium]
MTRFTKLHATGNDFLVTRAPLTAAQVSAACERHRGIGADGVIILGDAEPANGADATMLLRNADGVTAEMSGNGIRCLAWVARRDGLGTEDRLVVDTGGGRRTVELDVDPTTGDVRHATVDMGPVTFDPPAIPITAASPFELEAEFHGVTYRGDAAGMGNPHLVLFVDDPDAARVTQHGPHLERDDRFPNRTNVEFVALTAVDELTVRTWERGVGETLSCGTGACAAAAVAHRRGLVGTDIVVHELGGDLRVELTGETIRLGGGVTHVFDVDWAVP